MSFSEIKRYLYSSRIILSRAFLHSLVSWRFIFPSRNLTVRMHRAVFLYAFADRPIPIRLFIFFYSYLSWLFYHGWRQVRVSFVHNSHYVYEEYGVSRGRQLLDLFRLAYLHGITPRSYYSYKLFRLNRKKWFDFIYPQELPQWHFFMSPAIGQNSRRILVDKGAFEQFMLSAGLPVPQSVARFRRGQRVNERDVLLESSHFFKPVQGNNSRGCFTLEFLGHSKYKIKEENSNKMVFEDSVVEYINRRLLDQDYLMQALIENHSALTALTGVERLVTLRVISVCLSDELPEVVSALLEIPANAEGPGWWIVAIDCDSGCLLRDEDHWFRAPSEYSDLLARLVGQAVPEWKKLVEICIAAHQLCPDVFSVGWDAVITNEGVFLLEGNINWQVDTHQLAYGSSALQTRLGKAFLSRFEHRYCG